MAENIDKLLEVLKDREKELDDAIKQMVEIDSKRLEKAVENVLKSVSFNSIWTKKERIGVQTDSINSKNKYKIEKLMKDGKLVKGILVDKYDSINSNGNAIFKLEDYFELWLTDKGFIKTHVIGNEDNTVYGKSQLLREVLSWDYDPLTLNENKEYEWNIDHIMKELEGYIVKRIEDLEDRIISASERLKELRKLEL